MIIVLDCCKTNIEISAYEPKFTNTMFELELCKIEGKYKHLRCLKNEF